MPVSLEVAGELVDLFVFGTMTLFQKPQTLDHLIYGVFV